MKHLILSLALVAIVIPLSPMPASTGEPASAAATPGSGWAPPSSAAASPLAEAAAPTAIASPGSRLPAEWAPKPGMGAFDPAHPPIVAMPAAGESAVNDHQNAGDDHATAKSKYALTPGERAYLRTRDASMLAPRNWAVMVYKARHELAVYYQGELYKKYRAVFGRSREPGTKVYEGDRRTPEGVYTIVEKYPSYRWKWFMKLDYPNAIDQRRYDELRTAQVLPVVAGKVVGEGGRIGIHGTDNPVLNRSDVNWTTGCISVENADINELHRLLPVGTVVIIRP